MTAPAVVEDETLVDVTVYSTATCPYCRMVKDYLRRKGVPFAEVDVSADRAAAAEMVKRSGRMGVPQIVIGGKVIVGFDRDAIDRELARG